MTPPAIDGLVIADRAALEALGLRFPEPLRPPPETADVLHLFREAAVAGTDQPPRFLVRRHDPARADDHAVGAPDEEGRALIGYGVYPEFERQGYATEAARALVEAAFARPDITAVRATIHPTNPASRRVAEKAGMVIVDSLTDPEEGLLDVWEVRREAWGSR
jgi:RimJ/RimL family protein N-acetyltransferase